MGEQAAERTLSLSGVRENDGRNERMSMGWNDAPTMPDVQEYLTSLTDEDWEDYSDEGVQAVQRLKTATRDGRTARQHFDHLYGAGVSVELAYTLTLEWLENGGDATKYIVKTLNPQQRVDLRKPRSHFDRLTTGKTDKKHPFYIRNGKRQA